MITLGINAAFHDSSAALVRDGELVAAAEEERFTRIKHAKRPLPFTAWELPFHAIDFCLAQAGVRLADVDHVAYAYDPQAFIRDRLDPDDPVIELPLSPSAHFSPADGWENPWDPLFASYIVNAPRQLASGAPHHLKSRFAGVRHDGPYRWHWVSHHLAHQASAFLAAPFARCAVMTLDGRGEDATTAYGRYRFGRYEPLREVTMPSSLGLVYEKVTAHLGFLHSSDEYKVMALAAMGEPRFAEALRRHVTVQPGGQYTVAGFDCADLFGPARARGTPMAQVHFDIAASLQQVLEATVVQLARWLAQASGERHLAMAGGVALNCVMNSRLRDAGLFDAVWVQPAAGDAGTALGAALWTDAVQRHAQPARRLFDVPRPAETERAPATEAATAPQGAAAVAMAPGSLLKAGGVVSPRWSQTPPHTPQQTSQHTPQQTPPQAQAQAQAPTQSAAARPSTVVLAPRRWEMQHAYWGPEFADEAIERELRWAQLPVHRLGDVADEVAEILAADRIIGWFQGRMEFGPRALGARSILASPRSPTMQQRLNELKDREDFRPVAPVLPIDDLADWFEPATANGGASPFMLFVYDARADRAAQIPAVCHTDRSARVQTVARGHGVAGDRLHALLKAFGRRTGVPVLVNTSFNVRGEPVVCTPRDALNAFWTTPLDALVLGSYLLVKPGVAVPAQRAASLAGSMTGSLQ
jgi:carbamoyltransferase